MRKKSIKLNGILNVIKNFCTIGFQLITVPYLSRTIGIEGYGAFNYANSIISYFILFAGLGFSTYAVREGSKYRDDKDRFTQFASEIFSLNIISTLLSLLSLYLLILTSDELDSYRLILLVLSINIFINTLGMEWVNVIYEDYIYITLRYCIIQVVSLALLIHFVHSKADIIVYAVIYLFSQIMGSCLNIFYIRRYVKVYFILIPSQLSHLKPSFILFINSLAATIYVNSDITILGMLTNTETVGIYSIASKIYGAVKMISVAALNVTIPRLAVYVGKTEVEKYNDLLHKIINSLMIICFPMLIGLLMNAKNIIVIIADNSGQGHNALKLLSIALIFATFAYFFSQCILIPNKAEKYFMNATLTGAVINLVLNFLIIPFWFENGAAFTTLIAEIIVFSITYHYAKQYSILTIQRSVIKSTMISSLIIAIISIVGNLLSNAYISLVFNLSLSILIWIVIMLKFKNELVTSFFLKLKVQKNKADK